MTTGVLLRQSFAGGGGLSVGDDHQNLTQKGKNRCRSLERRANAQEKAQQVQGRASSNLKAKERVGPANKGAP